MSFNRTVFTAAIVLLFEVSQQCSKNLCFTWIVTADKLILKCRAHKLIHGVYIYDQFGHLQADCLPPFPYVQCQQIAKDGTIKQDIRTNVTIYTVTGKVDTHLNGNWTCRHGFLNDIAKVQVTIIKIKEYVQHNMTSTVKVTGTYVFQGRECMLESLVFSFTSVLLSLVLAMIALTFNKLRVLLKDLFKQCLLYTCNRINNVYRFHTVFLLCMLLYFGVIVAVTFNSEKTCTSKFIFLALGPLIGTLLGCLCLRNEARLKPEIHAHTEMEHLGEEVDSPL